MAKKKNKGKRVVLVGRLYEKSGKVKESEKSTRRKAEPTSKKRSDEMGKFLLSIPKDLRREIKFESDERGFGNVSAYICHILRKRKLIFSARNKEG
jgi:hypothetical protein